MSIRELVNKILFKYIHQQWNIGIADFANDLIPKNIKWMKHSYTDRWFADPFIIDESDDSYTILAEEYLRDEKKGRLVRLLVSKNDCKLLHNETILELTTHLSFPNAIVVDGVTYIYPENSDSGCTNYYVYGKKLTYKGVLSNLPMADPVIFRHNNQYYLLYTIGVGEECNGNTLHIDRSASVFDNYHSKQMIKFNENIARRAGNVFEWNGHYISPAQICNHDYGEGVSLQEIIYKEKEIQLKEIKKILPVGWKYQNGFHTYNVWKNKKIAIDGYKYKSKFLHDMYFKIRT